MIVACPSSPIAMVIAAITTNAIARTASPEATFNLVMIVSTASVASATRTISHPTSAIHETNVGSRFPRTPNAARDRTSVGADPFFPASEMKPTRTNDRIVPSVPASTACQRFSP
jgi:hypothetical protein